MFRRTGTRIRIGDFDKAAVGSAESAPTAAECISLGQSDMEVSGGFAHPINAPMPDKHDYERLRFVIAPVGAGITGAPTSVEFTLWERTPDGEVIPASASVALAADGTIPAIEIDNHDARYGFTVSTLSGGTTPAVTVGVWVQGVYTPTYAAVNGN